MHSGISTNDACYAAREYILKTAF